MKRVWPSFREAIRLVLIISPIIIGLNWLLSDEYTLENLKWSIFYNLYYGLPLSMVNSLFFDKISEIFSWEKQTQTRLWAGIIGSVVLTMATLIALNYFLWIVYWDNDISILLSKNNIRSFYFIAFVITVIITTVIHAVGFFKEAQNQNIINEKLKQEKLKTELNALKAHIDPHFLFNSFNILSGLIEEDQKKAQNLLNQLSSIYRHILEQRDNDLSTVREEVNFAKKYLSIHQTRFEDSINLEIDIQEALYEGKIPALSLQLLLENAIKHNAFSKLKPLDIKIYSEKNNLIVQNNKKERSQLAVSSGMGLKNIQDRYKLLSGKYIEIFDDQEFTVKLPIL